MRRIQALLATAVAGCAVGALAPSAGAVGIRRPDGRFVGVMLGRGVSPAKMRGTPARQRPRSPDAAAEGEPNTQAGGDIEYQGGPVLHTSSPYLIFWDPSGSLTARNKQVLERYLTDVAADTQEAGDTYGVGRQYYDSAGYADAAQTFSPAQVILDTHRYPREDTVNCTEPAPFTACVTDAQVRAELRRLIALEQLPTDGPVKETEFPSGAPIYVLVLPVDTNECETAGECVALDSSELTYCAYHTNFTEARQNVLYAVLPFAVFAVNPTKGCQTDDPANTALQAPSEDEAENIADNMSHELNETITDPLGTGWVNYPTGDGQELADNCEEWGATAEPELGQSPDAYEPTLGGSAIPVPPDPDGTLYDQLINGDEYYTQSLWSNGDANCLTQTPAAPAAPRFTTRAEPRSPSTILFYPAARTLPSDVSSTTWDFGDGSAPKFSIGPPVAVLHGYGAPGDYTVTLTVIDVHGARTTSSHTIAVGGP